MAIIALVFIVYTPILPGHFLMDDHRLVKEDNPLTKGQLSPASIWFQTDFALSTFVQWREWVAWGESPCGYHAVNILFHALSALLLWRLLASLLLRGAWLAAALFAVHPVCVNSVARISELKNTLSLPFFLLSIWIYLPYLRRERRLPPGRYGLALVAFVLALMSKTSTVMLPMVLLACAAWMNGRITRRDLLQSIPFFAVAAVFGLMSAWFQKHQAMTGPALPPESFLQRFSMAGRVFWFYFSKALWPVNLNLVYPQWKADATGFVGWMPALLFVAVMFVCWRFRRDWGRHVLFGLGVFAITLFPALGFFDSQFLTKWRISDHLQYLPLMAPVTLAACGIASILPLTLFRCATAILVLAFSVLTYHRAKVFNSEETLFRDTLAKNPAAWGPQNDLGVILAGRKEYFDAIKLFEGSIQSNPENPDAESNLAQTLALQRKFKEAEPHFLAAVTARPNDPEIHRRYAVALAQQGRGKESLRHFGVAIALSPKVDVRTRLDYATALLKAGDLRRARAQLEQALALQPNSVEALNNLAWLLATAPDESLRDSRKAVLYAERASRLPTVDGICVAGTLAAAYAEAGRFSDAVATAEKAVETETESGQTHFAAINRQLLQLYRAGRAFHSPPVSPDTR